MILWNAQEQRSFGSFIKSLVVTRSPLSFINFISTVQCLWFGSRFMSPFYKGKNAKHHHWSALFKVLKWTITSLGTERHTTPQPLSAGLSSTHARPVIDQEPFSILNSSKGNGWSYLKFHGPLWTYLSFNTKKLPDHRFCDLNNYIISPQNMFPGTKRSFSFWRGWCSSTQALD